MRTIIRRLSALIATCPNGHTYNLDDHPSCPRCR